MDSTYPRIAALFAVLLITATCAAADDDPDEVKRRIGSGNPVDGRAKAVPCRVCHSDTDNPDEPVIPRLAGQYADYIQRQIYNFQEGTREDPDMTRLSASLTNRRDMADIAAFFASQNQMKGTPVQNEAGEKLYLAKGCKNCHGDSGRGKPIYNSIFPIIGGQKKAYLIKQMKNFKSGERATDISGIMTVLANQMTYDEIVAVSEFLSGQ